ncbi:MAG: ribonuclease E inhibitor RraB [Gaiellaceae bacterium]
MQADTSQGGDTVRHVERVLDGREADVRVLDHLALLGCDPAQPRGVRHFIYVPAQDSADSIAAVLQREGWETSISQADELWLVAAACLRVLTQPLVREVRTHLESLAVQHGGEYDGWEAETA